MAFLLVRLSILFILEAAAIIILIKKHKTLKARTIILLLCIPFLIHILSYYVKFESPFLRFNTVEEAVSYSIINGNVEEVYDTEDCIFLVYSGFEQPIALGAINKYGDKFGMLDETAELINYEAIKVDFNEKNMEVFTLYSVYNNKTKLSLLQIDQNYGFGTVNQKETQITTKDGDVFEKMLYTKNNFNDMLYTKVLNGKVEEGYTIIIRGEEFELKYT